MALYSYGPTARRALGGLVVIMQAHVGRWGLIPEPMPTHVPTPMSIGM